jgi:eukaryotic-like serine/threonine-protein kinase
VPDQHNAGPSCPRCGRLLPAGPADAPTSGLCPKCLLSGLFADTSGHGSTGALAGVLEGALRSSGTEWSGPHGLPRAFGAYELLEEIARGGMGIVYRARQRAAGRIVALKVLATGHFASPEFIRRFRTEAEVVATLDHPNIVPTYEVGELEGHPFFSMKFVEGGSLAGRIAALKSPIANREAAELLAKLARAVHYAHQRGVLHRDIKPGNVLLDTHGEPHLTDFGLAKLVEKDSTLTHTMAMLGTPSYMSPEQARGEAKQLTTSVDVYGLGAVFYELLTGQAPFGGGTTMEIVRRVLETEPRRPSTLRPEVNLDLETICLKCLEKDPGRRYGSAEALAFDLERWLRHEPIVARPSSLLERTTKWIQRNRAVFLALTAIAVLLVTGVSVSTWLAVKATNAKEAEVQQRVAVQSALAQVEAQQKQTETQRQQAEEQRKLADEQRQRAEAELKRAEWLIYAGKLMQAQTDFELGNGGLARHYLEQCDPRLRGWEWRHLSTRISAQRTFSGHKLPLWCTAFSPDGQRIVTGGFDKTARVWDAATGSQTLVLSGHKGEVLSLAFSPDGQRIVSGGGKWAVGKTPGEVMVWDAATGQLLLELEGHNYAVWGLAFSPDGQRIVTGAGDRGYGPGEVIVWDALTGLEILSLPSEVGNVRDVAFSPDGKRIVTASTSGAAPNARVWDAATGQPLLAIDRRMSLKSVAFSPDGDRIVTGGDNVAIVWDAATGQQLLSLKGHKDSITSVAFSQDGRRILTSSADHTTKVWHGATGVELFSLKEHSDTVLGAAFSPNGKHIVTASADKSAKLWDAENGQQLPTLKGHADSVYSIAFSPDSRRIATGSQDGTLKLWDAETKQELLTLQGLSAQARKGVKVYGVTFSPDGQRLASANNDQTARVFDMSTGEQLLVLQHSNTVSCVAFSPDGQRIVTTMGAREIPDSKPSAAFVWDATTGRELLSLTHSKGVRSAAISPDGRRIVTGCNDGVARIWDAASGELLLALNGHTKALLSVAFSPDGHRILTGSWDDTAKVWDAASGEALVTLKGHTGRVRGVAFSPDGQRIATCSDDRTARIWNAATGEEAMILGGHTDMVWSAAFSPDGQWIATGIAGAVAIVTLWFAPTQ